MDRANLETIEEKIKRGEETQFLRILGQRSGKSKRIILRNENGLDDSGKSFYKGLTKPSNGLVKSRFPISLEEINDESNEVMKAVVEAVRPKRRLVIFGAGNVGQAVGLMGALLGFNVILVDDRPEFASRERFPDRTINLIVGDYVKVIGELNLTRDAAVVIVTRGHQFDEICLRGTVRLNVGYLGMIGSKRRVLSIIDRLEKDGFRRSDFEKLHAPIGLRIGAASPQEIAIAILAEIVGHFNGKNVGKE
jgi:xanthine/CO dehydrogenase XdhC/CoxF family maturation factor